MKRFMAILLLMVLVTASSCSYYSCATYTKTGEKQPSGSAKI